MGSLMRFLRLLTLGLLAQAGKGKECARGAAAPSALRWVWGGRV